MSEVTGAEKSYAEPPSLHSENTNPALVGFTGMVAVEPDWTV